MFERLRQLIRQVCSCVPSDEVLDLLLSGAEELHVRANSAAIAAYAAANPDIAEFGAYNWVAAEYGDPWYLPAKEELRTFWAVMCGLTPEQIATYNENPVSGSWALYVETQDYSLPQDMMKILHGSSPGMWISAAGPGAAPPSRRSISAM